jgi:peptidoglycan-associated lipoprotein
MYRRNTTSAHSLSGGCLFFIGLFLLFGCSQETASKPPEVGPQKVAAAQKPSPSAPSKPSQDSSLEAHQKGTLGKDAQTGPLGDVNFDFDRYDLRSDAKEILKSHAAWLRANPQASVEVEGHCDERGTNEYNLALGAKRAESVKRYLVDLGILPGRISTISYGEELSICKEQNEACWAKNRRARFVLRTGPTT